MIIIERKIRVQNFEKVRRISVARKDRKKRRKMFQWPLIVVLVVSMFDGRVCPVVQKGHDNGDNHDVTKGNNATVDLNNNVNNTIVSSKNTVEDKKDAKSSIKDLPVLREPLGGPAKESPPNAKKTIEDGKHDCNTTKEVTDMIYCNVTPPDDDAIIEQNSNTTESPSTTIAANNKTEASTESRVTKVTSQESNEKENGKKTLETVVPLNHSETTDKISYDVVSTEPNHPIPTNESEVSGTTSKQDTNTSEAPVSSVAPLQTDSTAIDTQSKDVIGAVKSSDTDNNKPMPSGLIALVTAISFAVAIATVYIGMIIWRRYIEYRYGHRELLVNELEFDTNDLRHFEL